MSKIVVLYAQTDSQAITPILAKLRVKHKVCDLNFPDTKAIGKNSTQFFEEEVQKARAVIVFYSTALAPDQKLSSLTKQAIKYQQTYLFRLIPVYMDSSRMEGDFVPVMFESYAKEEIPDKIFTAIDGTVYEESAIHKVNQEIYSHKTRPMPILVNSAIEKITTYETEMARSAGIYAIIWMVIGLTLLISAMVLISLFLIHLVAPDTNSTSGSLIASLIFAVLSIFFLFTFIRYFFGLYNMSLNVREFHMRKIISYNALAMIGSADDYDKELRRIIDQTTSDTFQEIRPPKLDSSLLKTISSKIPGLNTTPNTQKSDTESKTSAARESTTNRV